MEIHGGLFTSFLIAALVICITPGPDMLYVLSFGTSQGRQAGVAAAAGVAAGMLTHAILTAFGMSLLISKYPALMTAFKVIGFGYLIYLGVAILRDRSKLSLTTERAFHTNRMIAFKAMVVNLANPKVVIFYISFLPQFTSPTSGPIYLQILLLGAIFVAIGFVTDGAVGLLSGALWKQLGKNAGLARAINISCGVIMFALAVAVIINV